MDKVIVHAYMIYKCVKCGKTFRMWCEKGIEDGNKPSPFVIAHDCGGFAKDISGLFYINQNNTGYIILPDGESYFANKDNVDCGVAVIRN